MTETHQYFSLQELHLHSIAQIVRFTIYAKKEYELLKINRME